MEWWEANTNERSRGSGLCNARREHCLTVFRVYLCAICWVPQSEADRGRQEETLSGPGWRRPGSASAWKGFGSHHSAPTGEHPNQRERQLSWATGEEGHWANPCPHDGRQAEREARLPWSIGPRPGDRWNPELELTKPWGHHGGNVES